MADGESTLFKDQINSKTIKTIGLALQSAWPDFPLDSFCKTASRQLKTLELKDRVRQIMAAMTLSLPEKYNHSLKIVVQAGLAVDEEKNPQVHGFGLWPLVDWVGQEGKNHPVASLKALRRLTGRFSAEFAIRTFLLEHTETTLEVLNSWLNDRDHHVRRLVSEGTRSRLPWGQQLPMFMDDPTPVLKLLEALKDDESEYVRRSVANNLNDIAKDHPDLAAKVATGWMKGASGQRQRLVSHGLRTLVKQGHPGALKALGFVVDPKIKTSLSLDAEEISLGSDLKISAEIQSTAKVTQKLVVDFAVHYQKANGTLSPKIFKWKVLDLAPGQKIKLTKKQKFVPRSIRKLYVGKHAVELLVAGKGQQRQGFMLKK